MKAVILTCNTGQGHNSAGHAIFDELTARGVDCEIKDVLAFMSERASDMISGAFVHIAVSTPRAFGAMYKAGEMLSERLADKVKSPVYFANTLYAEALVKYLYDNHIDAAICPHLFPAEALTYLKRRDAIFTRCYFISTDYTCIPFLDETDMDTVFIPDDSMRSEFIERGIDDNKLVATGIPVAPKFMEDISMDTARRELGIPAGIPAFLVMTGGEGCGDAVTLTGKILDELNGNEARIVVLPGRNDELRNELIDKYGEDSRVMVEPFTDKVNLYMDACDVTLTKPGGISSTEAAVKGAPVIHTSPIPGCETLNARYFSDRGMSILAEDESNAAKNAVRLAGDSGQKERMREAQRQYINLHAARDIAAKIVGDFGL